jgi:hypothetical protein
MVDYDDQDSSRFSECEASNALVFLSHSSTPLCPLSRSRFAFASVPNLRQRGEQQSPNYSCSTAISLECCDAPLAMISAPRAVFATRKQAPASATAAKQHKQTKNGPIVKLTELSLCHFPSLGALQPERSNSTASNQTQKQHVQLSRQHKASQHRSDQAHGS